VHPRNSTSVLPLFCRRNTIDILYCIPSLLCYASFVNLSLAISKRMSMSSISTTTSATIITTTKKTSGASGEVRNS
jgi:hypothetical protein